ncbi:MAG: Acetyltransferase (GNAT) family [Idiomarinaceae bacterium HL-53]|nr:MAG: Acetyltransferase (GNAT) family [Idiomarinaceae bacterium HL-53]CUS49285.1 Acetyltransferase (GNAT) family protein [Idiomarinaceae bacterium HL-53]
MNAPALTGKLVYLASEDLRVAASLLYQAYQDDPLFEKIFQKEKEGFEQRLRAAIREELSAFWQAGHPMFGVFEGETLEGVVCLTRPGEHVGAERVWHWRLKMLLTAGFVSTRQLLEKERLIQEAMPVTKYHMVSFIAVHPRYQQKGLGDLLVKAVAHELQSDEQSEGVAVFATRAQYAQFFATRGYQKLADVEVAGISGVLMFLSREAQAAVESLA